MQALTVKPPKDNPMKPIHLLTIILFLQSCGVSRETIRYELPPKQAGDDPAKLQTILAFKTKDAEKLFDKDDFLLEGKVDELKKIAGKESSNPIVLKALAKVEGKLTNLDKAKAIYEKTGLTNNSHYAWVLHDYGDYYFKKKEFLTADEYYDESIKIFEGLGDKESLVHLLKDNSENNFSLARSLIDQNSPRLKEFYLKAKNLILKQHSILLSDDLFKSNNYNYYKADNLYRTGNIIFNLWRQLEEKKIVEEETKQTIDYQSFKDYELAINYFNEAFSFAKNNNEYNVAGWAAYMLGVTLNLMDLSASHRKTYIDLDKAFEYYLESADNFEKQKDVFLALVILEKALNLKLMKKENKKLEDIASWIFLELERRISESPSNNDTKTSYLGFKINYGEKYIEKNKSEEEVIDYYSKVINDKIFDKAYFKKNGYSFSPRERLRKYFAENRNYCDAEKVAKEEFEFQKSIDPKAKPDSELEKYTRRCKSKSGIIN